MMRKNTRWAASAVKKQLQGCCTYGRLPVEDEQVDEEIEVTNADGELPISDVVNDPQFTSSIGKPTNKFVAPTSRGCAEELNKLSVKPRTADGSLASASPNNPSRLQYVRSGPLPSKISSGFKHVYRSGPLPKLATCRKVVAIASNDTPPKLMVHSGPLIATRVLDPKCSPESREGEQPKAEIEMEEIEATAFPSLVQSAAVPCDSKSVAATLSNDRSENWAASKIQGAFRRYQGRLEINTIPSQSGLIGRLEKELDEATAVSTRMSRTDTQPRKSTPPAVSKGWNGSMRTAQDCQAILRKKQEATLKRERAMEYALSLQRFKSESKPQKRGPEWLTDDKLPDKPSWVRSWLERAARMGAHGTRDNRIFDNDSNPRHLESESLSVESTVGMCTTEIGSCEIDIGWQSSDLWPLSLRQQHEAGMLGPRLTNGPSPLQKTVTPAATPLGNILSLAVPLGCPGNVPRNDRSEQINNATDSTTPESSISPTSVASFNYSRLFAARRLNFCHESAKDDEESVGSCAGPVPVLSRYKITSHFVGPKVYSQHGAGKGGTTQHKLPTSNFNKTSALCQSEMSVALSDNSIGSTAASVRKTLWRP